MSTSLKLISGFLFFFLSVSVSNAEEKSRMIDDEIARIKKMSEDTHLNVDTWVKYYREIDERCNVMMEKSSPDLNALNTFFYGFFQIGNLFIENPKERTLEICEKYIRLQEISKVDSIHEYLEKIVDKLCLQK